MFWKGTMNLKGTSQSELQIQVVYITKAFCNMFLSKVILIQVRQTKIKSPLLRPLDFRVEP